MIISRSLKKFIKLKKREIFGFLGYISVMVTNLDREGLRKVVLDYDLFFIDIWGVVHNGLDLNLSAVETLNNLKKYKKEFVLLTNDNADGAVVIKV